jgi:hypothetical protein
MAQVNITERDGLLIEVGVKKINILLRLGLLCLAILPIAGLLTAVSTGVIKSPFGFMAGCLILGTCAIYLLRLYLWNTYGKEVYHIKDDEIRSYNSYRYFKDNSKHRAFVHFEISYSERYHPTTLLDWHNPKEAITRNPVNTYLLSFQADEDIFISRIPMPYNEIAKFVPYLPQINREMKS